MICLLSILENKILGKNGREKLQRQKIEDVTQITGRRKIPSSEAGRRSKRRLIGVSSLIDHDDYPLTGFVCVLLCFSNTASYIILPPTVITSKFSTSDRSFVIRSAAILFSLNFL